MGRSAASAGGSVARPAPPPALGSPAPRPAASHRKRKQTPLKTAETDMRGEDEMLSWAVIAETVHVEDALQLSKNENFIGEVSRLASGSMPEVGVYQLIAVLSDEMMQTGA